MVSLPSLSLEVNLLVARETTAAGLSRGGRDFDLN